MASQITYNLGYDLKGDQPNGANANIFIYKKTGGRRIYNRDFFHFSFSNKGENEVVRVQL